MNLSLQNEKWGHPQLEHHGLISMVRVKGAFRATGSRPKRKQLIQDQ